MIRKLSPAHLIPPFFLLSGSEPRPLACCSKSLVTRDSFTLSSSSPSSLPSPLSFSPYFSLLPLTPSFSLLPPPPSLPFAGPTLFPEVGLIRGQSRNVWTNIICVTKVYPLYSYGDSRSGNSGYVSSTCTLKGIYNICDQLVLLKTNKEILKLFV